MRATLLPLAEPAGVTLSVSFDEAVSSHLADAVAHLVERVAVDLGKVLGRMGSFTLPNGVITSYGYDAASRVAHLDHVKGASIIASFDYTFDKLGNRKTRVTPAGTESFLYDELRYRTSSSADSRTRGSRRSSAGTVSAMRRQFQ